MSTVDMEALIRAHEFRDVQPWTFRAGSGGRKIHARCWCGWQSVDTNDAAIAQALHGEHVAFLRRRPQGGGLVTPIDPPSEGQAPRAASAGRVQPPPGLLDKVREATDAVRDAHEFYASHGPARHVYGCTGCDARFPDRHGHPAHVADLVDRAAWDAVAEGLGLREALIFGGRRHLVSEPLEPQP